MRKYILEIGFQEKNIGVKETASEGVTVIEARLIVSILEEYKQKMVSYIMFTQHEQEEAKKQ